MNNKLKKIILVIFTFLFAIFLLNIYIKGLKTNKSDISHMNIINYIPSDYEFTILSNSTNNDVKKYINENTSKQKRDELNIIKDSIISYLGFDLQGKIDDIYDNEFALTFVESKLNKSDILLIFKLKKNKDINDIINLEKELNKSDQIIELKRLGKLNFISHIFHTKDNYIIASSNKKLIDISLQSKNNINKIISKNIITDDINLKEIKLLSISKNTLKTDQKTINEIITIINSEDNKLKLRSFSSNIGKINTKNLNNQTENIKDIIFTNQYSPYNQSIKLLHNNINQKEFIEEIYQKINNKLLFITNNNNWVLCFNSKLPNTISTDQFNFLKKYKKEDLYINNINYSIFTNDRLKVKDNNIIYDKENPIFSLKNEENTYISNNFNTLLEVTEKTSLSDIYSNTIYEIKPYKYIFNDVLFIKQINNKQLFKYFKSFKNLQYFINSELFALENINIKISQIIPEQNESVYLESSLKIL